MGIKQDIAIRSTVLKGHVNKYAMLGLLIALGSIVLASCLVSYQLTGSVSFAGIIQAQVQNPAIWALDLTPFMFAYWGQSFCYGLVSKAESIIEDKTREFADKSVDLETKLKYESDHDSLTNLPNNRLMAKRMGQAIQQVKKGEELALILITINDFREINFNIGSYNANSLLVQFSEKLKSLLLEPYMLQAYMGMNMVARLQGAEFAILIPRLREEHNLENILQNLIAATSSNYVTDGNKVEIKTTLGISLYPKHGADEQELIQNANRALRHAQKENKTYVIYEKGMAKHLGAGRVNLNKLKDAIENEAFDFLYKPIVQLDNNQIVGSEAYIRFDDEEFKSISADKLFPIIDGTNLIKGMTFFTLKKALEQLSEWDKFGIRSFIRVFLYEAIDPDLPGVLKKMLVDKKIPPERLQIELTEQACLTDQSHTLDVLNQLNKMGIKISIRDFGSGYSSFIYLTNFPIKEVRIAPSFTAKMLHDEKKHHIVEAIIKMADAMGLAVLADGVDNAEIKAELQGLGCTYGQGEFYSEAVDANSFVELLAK